MTSWVKRIDMGGLDLIVNTIRFGATKPGQAGTELSTTELGYLDGLTTGTVTASKALVVDANKDLASLRHLTVSTLTVGVEAVAAAGSAQGDATAMAATTTFVHATGADATKGIKLVAAAAGRVVIIKNADAANAVLKVYPATGDAINALSADAAISLAAKTSAVFVALDATTWYTIPLLPS